MKITALSPQIRNPDRVNVSIDGAYRFSLDISQVTDLGVRVGRELDDEELAQLEQESQFGKLYARALEYCLRRPRSVGEVRDYLRRKTRPSQKRHPKTGQIIQRPALPPQLAPRVLQRLIDKRYLDDQKFARFWLENRFVRKGASVRRLRLELRQKGVDQEIIDQVIAENIRSDAEELAKIIAKKRPKYRGDSAKFTAYLARQGFSYDDIRQALADSDDSGE